MRTALVCIAKDEDFYLDEWLKYHYRLSIDDIFLYQNDWVFQNREQYDSQHLHIIDAPGRQMQMKCYNHFLDSYSAAYDFMVVLDCDEFLNLKGNYSTIKDFLEDFSEYYAVGVNWRLFGDSFLTVFDKNNCSVLKRFIRCGKTCDPTIKTFLNLKKIRDDGLDKIVRFPNPHCVTCAISPFDKIPFAFTIATNKQSFCNKEFNYNLNNLPVQINHYHCKTRTERLERIKHGRCDVSIYDKEYFYTPTDFDEKNKNEVEDMTLAIFAEKEEI